MADTTADAAKVAAKYTWTAPADKAECYSDMKVFSDDTCETTATTLKVVATMKLGDADQEVAGAAATDSKWSLSECGKESLKFSLKDSSDATSEVVVKYKLKDDSNTGCGQWGDTAN